MSAKEAPPAKRRFRRFPRTLGECAEPLVTPVFRAHGITEMRIVREWASIVGPELAQYTVPHRIAYPKGKNHGAVLTLHAGGGFATEIQHREPVILEKLAAYFGYRAITRLSIQQAPRVMPAMQAAKPPPPPARPAAPLPAAVQDAELKAALERLSAALGALPVS